MLLSPSGDFWYQRFLRPGSPVSRVCAAAHCAGRNGRRSGFGSPALSFQRGCARCSGNRAVTSPATVWRALANPRSTHGWSLEVLGRLHGGQAGQLVTLALILALEPPFGFQQRRLEVFEAEVGGDDHRAERRRE